MVILCGEDQFLSAYARVKKTAEELERKGLGYPTFFEFIFAMGMVIFEEARSGVYRIWRQDLAADWMPQTALHIRCFASLRLSAWSIQRFWEIPLHRLPGKAGIIKTGVPVVFDANESEAAAVIADRARELHSPCTALEKKMYRMLEFKNNFIDFSLSTAYDKETRWTIPGAADYQVENAALAILAMRILQQQYPSAFSGDSFEEQLHSGMKERSGREGCRRSHRRFILTGRITPPASVCLPKQ